MVTMSSSDTDPGSGGPAAAPWPPPRDGEEITPAGDKDVTVFTVASGSPAQNPGGPRRSTKATSTELHSMAHYGADGDTR